MGFPAGEESGRLGIPAPTRRARGCPHPGPDGSRLEQGTRMDSGAQTGGTAHLPSSRCICADGCEEATGLGRRIKANVLSTVGTSCRHMAFLQKRTQKTRFPRTENAAFLCAPIRCYVVNENGSCSGGSARDLACAGPSTLATPLAAQTPESCTEGGSYRVPLPVPHVLGSQGAVLVLREEDRGLEAKRGAAVQRQVRADRQGGGPEARAFYDMGQGRPFPKGHRSFWRNILSSR